MKSSILRCAAFGAAAAALAVGAMVLPASAATNVTAVPFPEGTRFDYTIDADAQASPTRAVPTNGSQLCSETEPRPTNFYTTVSFTVAQSGQYSITDAVFGPVPQGVRTSAGDGYSALYVGAAPNPLDATCLSATDDTPRTPTLQAGQVYTLVLAGLSGGPGSYSMFVEGPGAITVGGAAPEGVTVEQAQAACAPGAAAPAGYNVMDGTDRNDTLRGTEGNDLIRGLGGQDTLVGLGGDDILCGGTGQDTLRGGAGEDFLFGEAGQDVLYGDADDDVLAGGDGNDIHDGGAGTDVALDTVGNNTFRGIESRTLEPTPVS